jgi:hypothetical protein
VLKPEVSERTTFTFSGSEQPTACERLRTIDNMECVMASLLEEIASGEGARVPWPPFAAPTLGVPDLTVISLLSRLTVELPEDRDPPAGPPGRVLDTGVEAQVHGPVEMGSDVEVLVADPSFIHTTTGEHLLALCRKHRIRADWHGGFSLLARHVPEGFRGAAIPKLAQRIAKSNGVLTAAVLGAGEASLQTQPEEWRDWAGEAETLQQLKQLWHVLVHYGTQRREGLE